MNEIVQNLKEKLKNGTLKLKVKVIANAKKNSIEPYDEEMIKIKINKIAVDGKANKAIVEYLSELLEVPKSNISIIKGEKTSLKDLQIVPKSPIIWM